MQKPVRQTAVSFKNKELTLEGVVSTPQGLSGPLPGAVLCHPHPVFGGTMESSVILGLARVLDQRGIASLRFNFRGVGASQGTFSNGTDEPEDLMAALDFFKRWPGVNSRRLALVGYSFGAQVVLKGLRQYRQAKALVLISPPLSSFAVSAGVHDRRARLFLVGERDRLVDAHRLKEQVASLPVPTTLEIVPGADHTWRGRELELAESVAGFLEQAL